MLLIFFSLLLASAVLFLLLVPLPPIGQRLLISFLNKLNSPMLYWPVRTLGLLMLLSFGYTIYQMVKYQTRVDELGLENSVARRDAMIQKFRAERNFYLHCIPVVMSLIIWRVQLLIFNKNKLEEEKANLQNKTVKVDAKEKSS